MLARLRADHRGPTHHYVHRSARLDANGDTAPVTTPDTAGGTREHTRNEAAPKRGGFEGRRRTAKDGNGKVTSFTYDTKGDLRKVRPPAP